MGCYRLTERNELKDAFRKNLGYVMNEQKKGEYSRWLVLLWVGMLNEIRILVLKFEFEFDSHTFGIRISNY